MIEVKFQETNSALNKHWPVSIKVDQRGVTIGHDVQRDRDQVHLSLEEWEWVVARIAAMIEAGAVAIAAVNEKGLS